MFPVDSLPTAYCEERSAAEAARLAARQQEEVLRKAQQAKQQPQQLEPQNLTQAVLQRPQLARPGAGVMGNIFQGFVRAASASPSRSPSHTPAPTPSQEKSASASMAAVSEEMEKYIAEKKRDADIVSIQVPKVTNHRDTDSL